VRKKSGNVSKKSVLVDFRCQVAAALLHSDCDDEKKNTILLSFFDFITYRNYIHQYSNLSVLGYKFSHFVIFSLLAENRSGSIFYTTVLNKKLVNRKEG
jgi:hypothetical protein